MRPLRWLADAAITVVMVLLAPVLVIPVAVAFLIACIRMQHFDLRTDADRPFDARRGAARHHGQMLPHQPQGGRFTDSNGYVLADVRSRLREIPRLARSYHWN